MVEEGKRDNVMTQYSYSLIFFTQFRFIGIQYNVFCIYIINDLQIR